MASCLEFVADRNELWREIERLNDEAESTRRIHFIAARKIQSWYRGITTRNHIRKLNEMAMVIQRHWRGYRIRGFSRKRAIDRANGMWNESYDLSATRIQAAWRGYRARKFGFDVRRTKNWIASIHEKNEQTQQRMRSFREAQLEIMRDEIEKESLRWILFILFKLHHLLGTKHRPGVLTSIDRTRRTNVEKMIKCLEYSVYVENKRFEKFRRIEVDDRDEPLIMRGTRFERCERAIREYEKRARRISIKTSEKFSADKKLLKTRVECLAREMWGDEYRDTLCRYYGSMIRRSGESDEL